MSQVEQGEKPPSTPRLRVRCPAELEIDGERLAGVVRNLGPDGLLVHVDGQHRDRLRQDQPLTLSCTLPHDGAVIRAAGRVAWLSHPAQDHRGAEAVALGVELREPEPGVAAALEQLVARRTTTVLLVGLDPAVLPRGARLEPLVAGDPDEALALLDRHEVGVLAVGGGLAPDAARELLTRAMEQLPNIDTVNVVFSGGPDLTAFQDLVSADRLFFLARQPISNAEMAAIVMAAARQYWAAADGRQRLAGIGEDGPRWQRVLDLAHRIASQEELLGASVIAARGIEDLVRCVRAYCLVYDGETDTVWSKDSPLEEERRESAAVGLVSFAVRTGREVLVERAGEDPRYDRDADDPLGDGSERLLALPVLAPGGGVLALLVAVREPGDPPFSAEETETLRLLATQLSPTFDLLSLKHELQQAEAQRAEAFRGQTPDLFREEALEHQRQASSRGSVLALSPGWVRAAYWLLLAMVVVGLLYIVLADVYEYAEGPAVIRIKGRTSLTALSAGTVTEIAVQPGQRVARGQVLIRFHDAQELAELGRIQREFELQLVNRLRDPADTTAGQALATLTAQRKLARARLDERTVRAPHRGLVGDVRVRPGQHVAPGDALLSLAAEEAEAYVIAMLPGQYRPQLKRGMLLRLELTGYERVFRELEVGVIGDEVVGPQEAKRYLGPEIADALAPTGPVVLLQAPLRSRTFSVKGQRYRYHDGMTGLARVRVRSDSVLVTLVPGLKALLETADGT